MPVPIACRCRISNQKFRVPRRARAQVSQIAAGRCTNPRVVRRRPRAREVGRGGAVRIACIASARAQIYHPTASPRVPGWPNSGSGAGQNRQHRASGRAGVELRCTASVAAARACIYLLRSVGLSVGPVLRDVVPVPGSLSCCISCVFISACLWVGSRTLHSVWQS